MSSETLVVSALGVFLLLLGFAILWFPKLFINLPDGRFWITPKGIKLHWTWKAALGEKRAVRAFKFQAKILIGLGILFVYVGLGGIILELLGKR